MLRTAVMVLSGNAFSSLMMLVRNLLIARLVSVEDYGIAATFAISMAVVEMAANLGLQQLIVQDEKGNDPKLQAGLQGFNALRGLISGAVLFLLAEPIAIFLNATEAVWAYQCLALVPILRGLEHFDIYRLNRSLEFRPFILSRSVPAFVALLAVWPLYLIFGDYSVMLYSVLIQRSLSTAISHICAKRRFRLRLDRGVMLHGLNFGWPLIINNIFMFVIFQGDKLIVGHEFGVRELGILSMGVTLTLTPILVLGNSIQQFMLPQLSASVQDQATYRRLAAGTVQAGLFCGIVLVSGVVLLGELFIVTFLGDKYQELLIILIWLALQFAIRAFRIGTTTIAMSKAQTSNAMIANIFRVAALPVAWYIATTGGSLTEVILCSLVGEAFGFVVSTLLIVRGGYKTLTDSRLPLMVCALLLGLLSLHTALSEPLQAFDLRGAAIVLIGAPLCLWSMRDLRQILKKGRRG